MREIVIFAGILAGVFVASGLIELALPNFFNLVNFALAELEPSAQLFLLCSHLPSYLTFFEVTVTILFI